MFRIWKKSLVFYKEILGYDHVVYDETDSFKDLNSIPGEKFRYRRVLLNHSQSRTGAFSQLLGDSQIELFQVTDREASNIFRNRFWGDLGFIHLCFDIHGMTTLRDKCTALGHPLLSTVPRALTWARLQVIFPISKIPTGLSSSLLKRIGFLFLKGRMVSESSKT
ncbi:MAG: hypothetical protein HC905_19735 [Bacteroidales bacterium]|nr:hypothetical protein [Bacteroidales bacterium]